MESIILILALSGTGHHDHCFRPKPACCEVETKCGERPHYVRRVFQRLVNRCCLRPTCCANGHAEPAADEAAPAPMTAPKPAPAPAPMPTPPPAE